MCDLVADALAETRVPQHAGPSIDREEALLLSVHPSTERRRASGEAFLLPRTWRFLARDRLLKRL
jgi:hypothetical protein